MVRTLLRRIMACGLVAALLALVPAAAALAHSPGRQGLSIPPPPDIMVAR